MRLAPVKDGKMGIRFKNEEGGITTECERNEVSWQCREVSAKVELDEESDGPRERDQRGKRLERCEEGKNAQEDIHEDVCGSPDASDDQVGLHGQWSSISDACERKYWQRGTYVCAKLIESNLESRDMVWSDSAPSRKHLP